MGFRTREHFPPAVLPVPGAACPMASSSRPQRPTSRETLKGLGPHWEGWPGRGTCGAPGWLNSGLGRVSAGEAKAATEKAPVATGSQDGCSQPHDCGHKPSSAGLC